MTAVAGCGSGPDIQVTEDRLMAGGSNGRGGVTKTVTARQLSAPPVLLSQLSYLHSNHLAPAADTQKGNF